MTLVVRHATATTVPVYLLPDAGSGVLVGVPSSVTATVRGPKDAAPVSAPGAVVDALMATVDVDALEGDDLVTLASAAAMKAGRRYLVTTPAGVRLVVESDTTITDSTMTLREPLPHPVPAGSTVKGLAVLVPLTSAQTEVVSKSERFGLIEVRGTVMGAPVASSTSYRCARRLAVPPLTPPELVQEYPAIKAMRSAQDRSLVQLIDAAWRNLVLPRVLVRESYPEDILDLTVLRPALGFACMLHAARQERQVDPSFVDRWRDLFDVEMGRVQARIDWHKDDAQSESPSPNPSTTERRFGGVVTR
jgi:hypothetical protein